MRDGYGYAASIEVYDQNIGNHFIRGTTEASADLKPIFALCLHLKVATQFQVFRKDLTGRHVEALGTRYSESTTRSIAKVIALVRERNFQSISRVGESNRKIEKGIAYRNALRLRRIVPNGKCF